jgi:RNA polymerase sigma-70 factor (ECF subfamily)
VELLNDFWLELLNARAICSFQGKTSLRSYLLTILNRRIIDTNRKFIRKKNKTHKIEGWGAEASQNNIAAVSPEEEFMHKEKMSLICEALMMLEKISTRNTYLMKMYLEGLGYTEMAQRELDRGTTGSRDLKKKINAIKKQFARNKTRIR